jgi:predicted SprT family Zn-dependent metalloprotease
MIPLSECEVRWGVIEYFPDLREVSDRIEFLEYRIDSLDDLVKLQCLDRMCVAHVPDPQHEDWLKIIEQLASIAFVTKINSHARSEDVYLLCDACGFRLVNTKLPNQHCGNCGNFFANEFIKRAETNSLAALAAQIRQACELLPEGKVLTLENTYEPPSYFLDLFQLLPNRVGFTFDIGHANLYHNIGTDYIYLLRDRLCHLHLHDNKGGYSEKLHDSHDRPGTGSVNWALTAKALNQVKFRGTATYECAPDSWWLKYGW